MVNESELLNLSSEDYLNISSTENLAKEFIENFMSTPVCKLSSSSTRLLSGATSIYRELEKILADLFSKDSALIFNTSYQCNLGVISSLARKGDVILSDKLNYTDITDGIKLSEADSYEYEHLNYANLEELLKKYQGKYNKTFIISETIFNIDGNVADIRKLVELKKKYNAVLMLDESNAFCSMDDNFAGMSDKNPDVDIITATFDKALGSFGAFVVSNKTIINYLMNKAHSYIYSTSIPPINIAWTKWLLTEKRDYITEQKQKLAKIIIGVHKYLKSSDIKTDSESHIIPLVLGDDKKTTELSERLKGMGYYVKSSTTPTNTPELKLSLTSGTDFENVKLLVDFIKSEFYTII